MGEHGAFGNTGSSGSIDQCGNIIVPHLQKTLFYLRTPARIKASTLLYHGGIGNEFFIGIDILWQTNNHFYGRALFFYFFKLFQ